MTSMTIFLLFIPFLAIALLALNLILAPHKPYGEKRSSFECGFHSFLGQNRTEFAISFFIFAMLFLIFDLEILLVYPYAISSQSNDIYGLAIMLIFFLILTLGFAFELGKNALKIDSRQVKEVVSKMKQVPISFLIPIYKPSKLEQEFTYLVYSIEKISKYIRQIEVDMANHKRIAHILAFREEVRKQQEKERQEKEKQKQLKEKQKKEKEKKDNVTKK